ncbi:TraB/GumN family protein [Novosphingobium sp. KACC 22771]|uniref:TraB/GumN family protein n=1 Tax=Novosphingobium sp. KACC 22771 TaxID=3025670 RepID=UPI002365CECD|nr:TraB/GumN family protein [Novosphingobium sp. KACC 22771]WDF71626.1 TraB/GumN family protein [Novosphingobium sp. KACC 22771]
MKRGWAALAALSLAGGALWYGLHRPEPVRPALWQVEGPGGQKGWLLGTIHALPRAAAWREGPVAKAWDGADTVIVEIAALNDDAATARAFQALAHTPGLPPLDARVSPQNRAALARALAAAHAKPGDFADTESWAAALMLAHEAATGNPANGIDRAVLAEAGTKRVVELEGAGAQLAIFDRLPESAQRRLLDEAVSDAKPTADLATAWKKGDVATLSQETNRGILADPVLREALYAGRNRAWSAKIAQSLASGAHPFVAVGAAHMAGPDALPAMLAAQGYRVTRVQ